MRESTKSLIFWLKAWFAPGLRPNEVDFRRVRRLVFVCKGNLCRSAYAHALAVDHGLPVVSCGLEAGLGEPADPDAQRVAAARGVQLQWHRTSNWTDTALGKDDLVLAMEPWHLNRLGRRAFGAGSQVGLLGLWSTPPRRTIPDPYGLADASFEACFDLIDAAVDRLARQMVAPKGLA